MVALAHGDSASSAPGPPAGLPRGPDGDTELGGQMDPPAPHPPPLPLPFSPAAAINIQQLPELRLLLCGLGDTGVTSPAPGDTAPAAV